MIETIEEEVNNLFKEFLNFIKTNELTENAINLWINDFETKLSSNQMMAIINENHLWTKFLRKTLKNAFTEDSTEIIGQKFLELIFTLINKLSDFESSLETTLELMIGHSMFNDIMIDQKFINSQIKDQLVSILSLIYEKDSKLMNNNNEMIAIVLSAYNTSLSETDQKLLKLLFHFERNGLNLYRYQPFFWGLNGAVHYSVKSKQKEELLKEPKMEQILSLINENQLKNTLNNFPIDMPLNPIKVIDVTDGYHLSDPRFLLPLFYQMLSFQSLVKCHKFVSFGCLSYAIASLSSLCPDMRCLSYSILSRFYSHLESASFPKDRFLWIALIDCIRSGITSENSRLKSVIAVFMVRVIDVLLHPNDKLYESVRRFLVNRPTIHFNVLPDFYSNIYSSDIEINKRLQRFVISWIYDGIRTEDDIKLCLKRNVFSELMTLFDSDLSDNQNRTIILGALNRSCGHYSGAKVLVTEKGLFCWLKQTIDNFQNDMVIIDEVFNIVETVWKTVVVNSKSDDCLYPSFHYEVMDVLKSIVELNPNYSQYYVLMTNIWPENCISKDKTLLTQIPFHIFKNEITTSE